ncbi:MAG: FlgD immunoglobulin-like domain containing protein [Calditrichia bacterium]
MKALILFCLIFSVGFLQAASSQQNDTKPIPTIQPRTVWGPDAFGYIARDSNEPGGPPVNWIDISGIGTVVGGLGDDNIVGPFDIGFPFRYYWYDVTSFHVGSNGYIRFSGSGQLSDPFTNIPNPLPPNDILCPLTTDLNPAAGGTVYYWTNNVDTLIVSFDHLAAWLPGGSSGDHNLQIILSMVDTSITFNIGPQTGSFNNTNGMVGMENSAGDIGIQCYGNNLVPANYSIKFYYPASTSFEVHDMGVTRVQNENSGGFFVNIGEDFQANTTIKNFGNQNEGNFYTIAEVRQFPTNTLMFSDSVWIDTLLAGETREVTFPEIWTMNVPSDFYLRIITDLPGDMVASNDIKDVEFHVVDLPGELYLDDNTAEQTWSWSGGQGGMGVRYVPPTYPVKITELRAFLGIGTGPTLLEIYDDDGPNGQPGTLLASVSVTATTENWYAVNLADSGIVINDGAVYAAWRMLGTTSSGIGMDNNSIGSRQTWEYTGVWATFRDAEISDAMIRISVEPQGQVVFSDDFEGGLGNWTGDWQLTTEASHSPSHSFTDSPGGNYPPNATLIGEMASGVDLSGFFGATLEFFTKYELETGFDYCYLDASTDGGASWILLKTYNGEGVVTQFTQEVVDIGAFAGATDFRIRFRLVTDPAYEVDGMYVDDLSIIGSFVDESPPLMLFDAPQNYQGVADTFNFPVVITDLSGVATAELSYWLDNDPGTLTTINATTVSNDTFYFEIPAQDGGTLVQFYLYAEDGASPANATTSDTMAYIAGHHQIYDDGDAEFITNFQPTQQLATRFDVPVSQYPQVTTALLRIYTDSNRPIDSVTVHVWADNGGVPGADLITPFKIYPAATLAEPEAWTIVDLRSFNIEPSGEFWVGYENTSPIEIWQLYDSPVVYNRSSSYVGGLWSPFNGDFHIRCVLGAPVVGIEPPGDNLLPDKFALLQNYPNPFNPTTTIKYQLPISSEVRLEIYNMLGQKIRTLVDETMKPGYYEVVWDGRNSHGQQVSSGIYFYRFTAGEDFIRTNKMILMK